MICNQLDFLNGVFASLQSMSRPDEKTLCFGMETRTFARRLPHGVHSMPTVFTSFLFTGLDFPQP